MEKKEKPEWLAYLEEHGVVVLKNVLKQAEVLHVRQKYWDWLEMYAEKQKKSMKEDLGIEL